MKQRARGKVTRFFVFSSLLYLGAPALLLLTSSATSSVSIDTMAQRKARNASAFAIMVGEFRTSMGDLLFIKTERYLDKGVAYEPHIDADALAKTGRTEHDPEGDAIMAETLGGARIQEALSHASEEMAKTDTHDEHDHDDHDHDHEGHDHEGHDDHSHDEESVVATLIRTGDQDFRGFIGNLERQVKPWRDPKEPHQHAEGKELTELLPWYRLATLSDPHNVRNYMIGAWWLKTLKTPEQQKEALAFLEEGIAANPEAYELYLMRGYVLKDMEDTEKAIAQFKKSADLAIQYRPPGGPDSTPDWDLTDDEQMGMAMAMHITLVRDNVSTAAALQLTNDYLRRMPTEGSLYRVKAGLESGN